jgi:hypothetical protein
MKRRLTPTPRPTPTDADAETDAETDADADAETFYFTGLFRRALAGARAVRAARPEQV